MKNPIISDRAFVTLTCLIPKSMTKIQTSLIGQKFGRLLIVGNSKKPYYLVYECECGNVRDIYKYDIISGVTNSCGCYHKERATESNITHGKKHHPLYGMYRAMFYRCTNPKHKQYKDWGGRGISVCKEWHDINVFIDWALSNGWEIGLELDRHPNNNGNYEPSNCRFVTHVQNMQNTRRTKLNTTKVHIIRNLYQESFTTKELGDIFNVTPHLIRQVIHRTIWANS